MFGEILGAERLYGDEMCIRDRPKDILAVIWKEIRVAVLCGATLAAVNFVKMLLVDRLLLANPDVTIMVAFTCLLYTSRCV